MSITINLLVLGFFKYSNFFIESSAALLSTFGITPATWTLNVILPVGLSFYTFQSMSYAIDCYRKKMNAEKSFLDYATYVSFFPMLVAGPIVRAYDFLPQLKTPRFVTTDDYQEGAYRIAIGLFKKLVAATFFSTQSDRLFNLPVEQLSSVQVAVAAMCFGIQIYLDFSAYSDIAIGTARIFGFRILENFNFPYASRSLKEFWLRWHISLSSWLRDYLYISMGGNRRGRNRKNLNAMLTMLLGGLWHGANGTFLIWGWLHGTYLWLSDRFSPRIKIPGWISVLLVFFLVSFSWIAFRAQNTSAALAMYQILFTVHRMPSREEVALLLLCLVTGPVFHAFASRLDLDIKIQTLCKNKALFYITVACAIYFLRGENFEFIYFQF
ncbi:MBOAT family O-acyltransferase [Polaromonas sp. YR568]|uniref:MBOAT family O-acyltransferase n=1 Tax=Polaromonas sp. YR568 TaxID=1855301 RepID=UPI00398BD351